MTRPSGMPGRDCPRCPRLVAFRKTWREQEPEWFNAPVDSFGPAEARLLIVGLAPGLRGANRTGRPFTGDYAGDLLYGTLKEFGFAHGDYRADPDDGLTLADCRITNAVRCVPPENKPTPGEIAACRDFLAATIEEMTKLRVVVALGRVAHELIHRRARRPAIGICLRPRPQPCDRRADLVRQLSLLALQHQYRRAHAADVSRPVCPGAQTARRKVARMSGAICGVGFEGSPGFRGACHRAGQRPDPWAHPGYIRLKSIVRRKSAR